MRPISKCLIVRSLVICLGLAGAPANADLSALTFDDVYTYATDAKPVPSGYGGFDWSNLLVINGTFSPYTNTPYEWGRVSGNYTIVNSSGATAGISATSWPMFDFDGVYFTPCWYIRDLQVVGYLGGVVKYDTTVSFTTYVTPPPPSPRTTPQWFGFDYRGIDQLAFIPSGGWVLGGWFVMDNFTYSAPSAVPLPTALLLGLAGLGTATWKLRKYV